MSLTLSEVKDIADKLAQDNELYPYAEYLYQHIADKGHCPKCLGRLNTFVKDEDIYLKCERCGDLYE